LNEVKIYKHIIDYFILGKSSHKQRIAGSLIIKSLWEQSASSDQDIILNILIEKLPSLYTYGSKSVEFFLLLNYISENKNWSEGNSLLEKIQGSIKQSLYNTNNLMLSHPNLELYSLFYKIMGR